MHSRRHVLTVSLVLGLFAALAAAQPVKLEPQFPAGKLLLTQETQSEQAITLPGMPPVQPKTAMAFEYLVDIAPADAAGKRAVSVTIRRVSMRTEVPSMGMTMEYDSAAPADRQNPMLAATVGKLAGAKVSGTLEGDGRISNITGMDDVWGMLSQQGGMGLPGQPAGNAGENLIGNLLRQLVELLPDRPVSIGETWNENTEMQIPLAGTVQNAYQCALKDVVSSESGKVAVVEFTGRTTSSQSAPAATQPAAGPTVQKMDLTTSGQSRFNIATGLMEQAQMHQEGTITMLMPGMGQETLPVEMQMTTDTTTTLRPATGQDLAVPTASTPANGNAPAGE